MGLLHRLNPFAVSLLYLHAAPATNSLNFFRREKLLSERRLNFAPILNSILQEIRGPVLDRCIILDSTRRAGITNEIHISMTRSTWFGIAVLSAALSFGTVVKAQTTSSASSTATVNSNAVVHPRLTPEQKQEKRLAHMKKQLALSDAQVSQIRALWAQDKAKIQSDVQNLKSQPKGTTERKADRQMVKADRQDVQLQLKGILTADQQAKLKAMAQNRKSKRAQGKSAGSSMPATPAK